MFGASNSIFSASPFSAGAAAIQASVNAQAKLQSTEKNSQSPQSSVKAQGAAETIGREALYGPSALAPHAASETTAKMGQTGSASVKAQGAAETIGRESVSYRGVIVDYGRAMVRGQVSYGLSALQNARTQTNITAKMGQTGSASVKAQGTTETIGRESVSYRGVIVDYGRAMVRGQVSYGLSALQNARTQTNITAKMGQTGSASVKAQGTTETIGRKLVSYRGVIVDYGRAMVRGQITQKTTVPQSATGLIKNSGYVNNNSSTQISFINPHAATMVKGYAAFSTLSTSISAKSFLKTFGKNGQTGSASVKAQGTTETIGRELVSYCGVIVDYGRAMVRGQIAQTIKSSQNVRAQVVATAKNTQTSSASVKAQGTTETIGREALYGSSALAPHAISETKGYAAVSAGTQVVMINPRSSAIVMARAAMSPQNGIKLQGQLAATAYEKPALRGPLSNHTSVVTRGSNSLATSTNIKMSGSSKTQGKENQTPKLNLSFFGLTNAVAKASTKANASVSAQASAKVQSFAATAIIKKISAWAKTAVRGFMSLVLLRPPVPPNRATCLPVDIRHVKCFQDVRSTSLQIDCRHCVALKDVV